MYITVVKIPSGGQMELKQQEVPQEIKNALIGTKLKTEEDVIRFWNRKHPLIWNESPKDLWLKEQYGLVRAFIFILKMGDGSMASESI